MLRVKRLRYRVWANVLIGLGALVIGGAGGMARAGATAWLYPAEMVGIVLMFAALRASTFKRDSQVRI